VRSAFVMSWLCACEIRITCSISARACYERLLTEPGPQRDPTVYWQARRARSTHARTRRGTGATGCINFLGVCTSMLLINTMLVLGPALELPHINWTMSAHHRHLPERGATHSATRASFLGWEHDSMRAESSNGGYLEYWMRQSYQDWEECSNTPFQIATLGRSPKLLSS
jgi:hypothetical protein